jgi:hypothetical protein
VRLPANILNIQPLRLATVGSIAALALFLTGCATQPSPAAPGAPGFFPGIFHGLVALPALLASVLLPIRIYAFPNDGFWYDLGFCVGFVFSLGAQALPIIPFIGGLLTRRN